MKSFASDNYSSVHPRIIEYLQEINVDHAKAYGYDEISLEAESLIREIFTQNPSVFFVLNGTGANVLSLKHTLKTYNSVICLDSSHLNVNETAAPEAMANVKLVTVKSDDDKLHPNQIEEIVRKNKDNLPHSVKPKLVSIAQSTELGLVYTLEELKFISQKCKELDLLLHIDAARIYNACVALNCDLSEIIKAAKPDIMSLGATKNGLMFAEAVLIFNDDLKSEFELSRKQSLQLYSKMRYLSAQFTPFFRENLWFENAKNANKMCYKLSSELEKIPEVKITKKVETNQIFVILPERVIKPLQEKFPFYIWDSSLNLARFVTSFDTTEKDVEEFITYLKELL